MSASLTPPAGMCPNAEASINESTADESTASTTINNTTASLCAQSPSAVSTEADASAVGGAKDGVKPLSACINMLVQGAGGDGNILLNVGPRPDGVIDPAQAKDLKYAAYKGLVHGQTKELHKGELERALNA